MKSKCCNADVMPVAEGIAPSYICCKCIQSCHVADDIVHAPSPLAYRQGEKYYLETSYCGRVEIARTEYEEIKKLFSLKIT